MRRFHHWLPRSTRAFARWCLSSVSVTALRDGSAPPPPPQRMNFLGKNLVRHPHLVGPTPRIFVLVDVLLRERVDVGVRPLLGDLGDAPPDLHVPVGIVGILNRQRRLRVPAEVL